MRLTTKARLRFWNQGPIGKQKKHNRREQGQGVCYNENHPTLYRFGKVRKAVDDWLLENGFIGEIRDQLIEKNGNTYRFLRITEKGKRAAL